jgi:hypothetical protein
VETITILAFIALAISPLVLAMRYGDQLLDALSRRKRKRKKASRQRKTRLLPIRTEEVNRLLAAEEKQDALNDRIAEGLEAFARLSPIQPHQESEGEIEAIEQTILANESKFGIYLDYAWFQSETLEVLAEEARLLRKLVDLPEEGLPVVSGEVREEKPRSAPDRLLSSLQDALDRKSKADRRLGQIGREPGAHFDATIADDI